MQICFCFFFNFALFISILSFIQTPLVVNVRPGFPQLHSKNIVVVSTLWLIVADCFPWKKKHKKEIELHFKGGGLRSLSSSFFCGLREFGINLIKQIKGKIFLKIRNTTNKIGTIHRQYNKRNCLATGNTYRIGFFFLFGLWVRERESKVFII